MFPRTRLLQKTLFSGVHGPASLEYVPVPVKGNLGHQAEQAQEEQLRGKDGGETDRNKCL
jgi:hypothetical protein